MTETLRRMIRTILVEELAARGVKLSAPSRPKVREEMVSIKSDQDLAKFVGRLMDMARDDRTHADVASGRHVFRLSHDSLTRPSTRLHTDNSTLAKCGTVEFSKGLVTEKYIHGLPDDVAVVKVGKGVRLTPLASDAIRQAGINIERVKT